MIITNTSVWRDFVLNVCEKLPKSTYILNKIAAQDTVNDVNKLNYIKSSKHDNLQEKLIYTIFLKGT